MRTPQRALNPPRLEDDGLEPAALVMMTSMILVKGNRLTNGAIFRADPRNHPAPWRTYTVYLH